MMLMPCPGPMAMTTGTSLVTACAFAPKADTFVVARVSTSPDAPLAAKVSLPGPIKLFALIRIPVAEKTLLAGPDSPISLVVIRHLHPWASQECRRVANSSSRSRHPVDERRDQSGIFGSPLSHGLIPFSTYSCLPVPLTCILETVSRHRTQPPQGERTCRRHGWFP